MQRLKLNWKGLILILGLFLINAGNALSQGACDLLVPLADDLKAKPELEDFFKNNPSKGIKSYEVLLGNPTLRKDQDALRAVNDYLDNTGYSPTLFKADFDSAEDQLELINELNTPFVASLDPVWSKNAFKRGNDIEVTLGQNLPPNFPVLDKYDKATGVATSIKSLNLNSPSYQNSAALESLIKRYLDKLDAFTSLRYAGAEVGTTGFPINKKVLEIAIPQKPTPAQQFIFDGAIATGRAKGIDIIFKVF